MEKKELLAIVCVVSLALAFTPATGDVLLKMTFDGMAPGSTPGAYVPASGDVMNEYTASAFDSYTGLVSTPTGTGLYLHGDGSWGANNGGYSLSNGGTTRLSFGYHPEYGNYPFTSEASGATFEAVVKFDAPSHGGIIYQDAGRGWSKACGGIRQIMFDETTWGGAPSSLVFDLSLDGSLKHTISWNNSALIGDGLYHHVAGVFTYAKPAQSYDGINPDNSLINEILTPTGDSTLAIYVDGVLKAQMSYLETQGNFEMTFNDMEIGNTKAWAPYTFNGVIDAAAISNSVDSFALIPEPATLIIIGLGGLFLNRRK